MGRTSHSDDASPARDCFDICLTWKDYSFLFELMRYFVSISKVAHTQNWICCVFFVCVLVVCTLALENTLAVGMWVWRNFIRSIRLHTTFLLPYLCGGTHRTFSERFLHLFLKCSVRCCRSF